MLDHIPGSRERVFCAEALFLSEFHSPPTPLPLFDFEPLRRGHFAHVAPQIHSKWTIVGAKLCPVASSVATPEHRTAVLR